MEVRPPGATEFGGGEGPGNGGAANLVGNSGGLDLTNLALGITDFAIERSKMELSMVFFERFHKFLDKNPECKTLFPNTLQQLNRISTFQFNEFLPVLRSCFFNDLKAFPDNINSVLSLPRYQKLLANFPEITAAIRSISAARRLKSKEDHLNIVILKFSQVTDIDYDKQQHRFLANYGNTWKLINIISTAFVDPATGTYYNNAMVQQVIEDDKKLGQLLAGLEAECTAEDIYFFDKTGNKIYLANLIKNTPGALVVYRSYFEKVMHALNDFEATQKDAGFKLQNEDMASVDKKQTAINYLNAGLKGINAISSVFALFDSVDATPYLDMVRNTTQITRDALNQDYPSLVANSMGFLESVFDMADATGAQLSPQQIADHKTIEQGLCVLSSLLKYANFAANVVTAKSPAEVKNAIETAALPPGSSSIKKHSNFNISLQIHLGGAVNCKTYGNSATPALVEKSLLTWRCL